MLLTKLSEFSIILVMVIASTGCLSGSRQDRSMLLSAKRSFIAWNLDASASKSSRVPQSRALMLASKDTRELESLMQTRSAPSPDCLIGRWNGVNKGVGAALVGVMQDVKVFTNHQGQVCGYNVLVRQVPIDQLFVGYRPKLDECCREQTIGNFKAVWLCEEADCTSCQERLVLDYSVAHNAWNDPTRRLVDEIVSIDHDLLLGRAYLKVGTMTIPLTYFALERAEQE